MQRSNMIYMILKEISTFEIEAIARSSLIVFFFFFFFFFDFILAFIPILTRSLFKYFQKLMVV